MQAIIEVAGVKHYHLAPVICQEIEDSAAKRGTGIAKRKVSYILQKMKEGKAVVATVNGEFAGFCYIESWQNKKYIANSGLIVNPLYRGLGLAKKIKKKAFELTRELYPNSNMFGLTTSGAVMKINSELGYKPVPFPELTNDEAFWAGCSGCINYDILNRMNRNHCLCTGMLYTPAASEETINESALALQNDE